MDGYPAERLQRMRLLNPLCMSEWRCWARLAWFDIVSRYRRTALGPLWIVLVTGLTIAAIGFVYSTLFRLPVSDFMPFLAIGYITWIWISTTFLEASTAFASYRFVLLNHVIRPSSIVLRVVIRNLIVLIHNSLAIVILFAVFGRPLSPGMLMVIPGMLVVGAVVFGLSTLIALVCTRFRDLVQLLNAVMSLAFLITPVIWMPEILGDRAVIARANPLTHLLDLIRLPLLGQQANGTSWLVAAALIGSSAVCASALLRHFRSRIVFWL